MSALALAVTRNGTLIGASARTSRFADVYSDFAGCLAIGGSNSLLFG